jgi:hypothetical protein
VSEDQSSPMGAFEALRQAHREAVAAVEAVADPEAAFRWATELVALTDTLVGASATARARAAHRIWEAEKLTISKLANRIGVSKSRADQFLSAARGAEDKSEREENG